MCWVVKATSVTATEFCGSVISSNLPVPVNSSLVHSWNSPWAVCLLFIMWKNVRVFVSHNSAGFHGTFHLHLETKKLLAKVWDSTCQTIWVCKQLQNVNFDGLTFLTALVLYSQSDIWTVITTILIGLLYYVSCFSIHFFRARTASCVRALQQNRAQSRLLYLLNRRHFELDKADCLL